MSKLNFFYDPKNLFDLSLKALERRNYKVLEVDEAKGIIKAQSKKKLLKPSVALEINIKQIDQNQTTLNIEAETKIKWLTPDRNYAASSEKKFIYTLYKLLG